MIAINILLSWDFSVSKTLKEGEKYFANHIEKVEAFCLFYQVIRFLEIQSSLDLFASPNYGILLSVYI